MMFTFEETENDPSIGYGRGQSRFWFSPDGVQDCAPFIGSKGGTGAITIVAPKIKTAASRQSKHAVNATTRVKRSHSLTCAQGNSYTSPKQAGKILIPLLLALLGLFSITFTIDLTSVFGKTIPTSNSKAEITLPSEFERQPRTVQLKAIVPKIRPGYSPYAVTCDQDKKYYIHPGKLEGKRFIREEHHLGVNELIDHDRNDTDKWFEVGIYEAKPSDVIEGGPYDRLPEGKFISDLKHYQRRALHPGEK